MDGAVAGRALGNLHAVVLTYNRKAILRKCLEALLAQTRPVDRILVVNNASTDGTGEMLSAEFPHVSVADMPENAGSSGGFHEGVKVAFEDGADWMWVMDDDCVPEPDCLERLCEHRRPDAVMVPLQRDSRGSLHGVHPRSNWYVELAPALAGRNGCVCGEFLFVFGGPLIHRGVVEKIGLPMKELFMMGDDIEYGLRIGMRSAADICVVPKAVVLHDAGGGKGRTVSFLGRHSVRSAQPAWYRYYVARNVLYMLTRIAPSPKEVLLHLLRQIRGAVGDIAYEPEWWERLKMRLKGVRDGVLGRLGKRVGPKRTVRAGAPRKP